mmetsp:Transcript_65871/g.155130  ORF Transcript_65871/g.155130 Transcript_65871/m.155130 type:complete len:251 (-) Transcript_65871:432-1184(-)
MTGCRRTGCGTGAGGGCCGIGDGARSGEKVRGGGELRAGAETSAMRRCSSNSAEFARGMEDGGAAACLGGWLPPRRCCVGLALGAPDTRGSLRGGGSIVCCFGPLMPSSPAFACSQPYLSCVSASSASAFGMKKVLLFLRQPMSLTVSKYCEMISSLDSSSVVACPPVLSSTAVRRPSMMAPRCLARPSPCSSAASACASAAFTSRILSASACMIAASRSRFCRLISFMASMTDWCKRIWVQRTLLMVKP